MPKMLLQQNQKGRWHIHKNAFLSTDKQFGKSLSLNFSENPPTILSCEGMHIRVSNQGIAVLDEDCKMLATEDNQSQYRGKRETATTEEMASELTAVEMKMISLIEHLFDIQCRSGLRENNPTKLARTLLKRQDVMAKCVLTKFWKFFHVLQ